MKYKVGDKVRVRRDLKAYEIYGSNMLTKSMEKFVGKTVTISGVGITSYTIEEMEVAYWTDEMFEPVEEMSAIEALEILSEICMKQFTCFRCPIQCIDGQKTCVGIRRENATEVVKVLEQWKADHEKKEVETEFVNIVLVIEDLGYTKKCVYEKDVTGVKDETFKMSMKRVLKEYCKEHEGKFFTVYEEICRVKE